MANFITTSVSYGGKEVLEMFFTPLFVGKSPLETRGVRVMLDVQSAKKLNFLGAASKLVKAYSKGFTGATGTTYTQRTLTVYDMKGEMSQDAHVFRDTVFEVLLGKGTEWNNLDKADMLKMAILTVFTNGVESDMFRQFWLSDTNKETVTGGIYTGTPDTNYNAFDGMLKLIRDNSAGWTSVSSTQIPRVTMSHAAAAQVDTLVLTGTSGSALITFNGVGYTATFATSTTVTAAAWVTANATALLARGVVVTSLTGAITFTSAIAGQPFSAVTITGVTADLTGTRTATTANTVPAALAADEAIGYLRQCYEHGDIVLRGLPKSEKVFLVDSDIYLNYEESLENGGAVDGGRLQIINGVETLTYRGIPVIDMGWQEHYDADFPTSYPNYIIYTKNDNLVMGVDSASDFAQLEAWYNKDEQENRFRIQYRQGCQYVHPKYTCVAF